MDPYIVLAKEIQGGTFSALRRQNALTQEEMAEYAQKLGVNDRF